MIKKFLSKALLSVVMDKSARENLETKQKINKAYKDLATDGQPGMPNPAQADYAWNGPDEAWRGDRIDIPRSPGV